MTLVDPQPPTQERSNLEAEKLRAEIQKLEDEVRISQTPIWKDIRILGPVAAFVVSMSGNIIQYFDHKQEIEDQRTRNQAEISKIGDERDKIKADIIGMKQKINTVANIERIKPSYFQELEQVKKDVAVWDGALFNDRMALELDRQKLNTLEQDPEKHPFMIQAAKENLAISERSIAYKTSQLDIARARQRELEALLLK
jgi:hypothetical protein